MEHRENSAKRKIYGCKCYIKKERLQINNLTLHLKNLQKTSKLNLMLAEEDNKD